MINSASVSVASFRAAVRRHQRTSWQSADEAFWRMGIPRGRKIANGTLAPTGSETGPARQRLPGRKPTKPSIGTSACSRGISSHRLHFKEFFLFSKSHGNYGTSIKDPEIAFHCRHKTQHDIISSAASSVLSMPPCSETHAPISPFTLLRPFKSVG